MHTCRDELVQLYENGTSNGLSRVETECHGNAEHGERVRRCPRAECHSPTGRVGSVTGGAGARGHSFFAGLTGQVLYAVWLVQRRKTYIEILLAEIHCKTYGWFGWIR